MSRNWVVVPAVRLLTTCTLTPWPLGTSPLADRPPAVVRRGDGCRTAPGTGFGATAGLAAPRRTAVPRFELPSPLLDAGLRRAAAPLANRRERRRTADSDRTGRPAWQSPYGPPLVRAHRVRWAPVPGRADSSAAVRHGFPCGRCE
ncbi:hypothetical protein [Streptomyces sp. NPDC008125]|uniref:hypothetical protein n=1 Tax=Streptomyces sp. NPDC008125 TaxID=3364811 RepID=UPI0036ECDCDF